MLGNGEMGRSEPRELAASGKCEEAMGGSPTGVRGRSANGSFCRVVGDPGGVPPSGGKGESDRREVRLKVRPCDHRGRGAFQFRSL